jgi:hypothetical protein
MDKNQPSRGGAALEASWHGRAMPKEDGGTERKARVSGETVYQAIVDLCAVKRKASRQAIAELTHLKVATVSDHIHRLKMDGRIRMIYNGVFEPTEVLPPDQPVGVLDLLDGRIKIERGDDVLTLTIGEWRRIGEFAHGAATQAGRMRNERDEIDRIERLERENRELRAQLHLLNKSLVRIRLGHREARQQRELPGMAEA